MSKLADQLRSQMNELQKKREAILALSAPLREARDKHVNEAREIENRMNAEIKEVEKDLFEIDNDLGALARAFGHRRLSDAQRR